MSNSMYRSHIKTFLKYGDDIPFLLYVAHKEKYKNNSSHYTGFGNQ